MYDGPQVAQGARDAGAKEPSPTERLAMELEQLNRRLDNYATAFQAIADRWFGAAPRSLADERVAQVQIPRAPNVDPAPAGRMAQLEQLLRVAHGSAQAIENQLDRLRVL